MALPKKNILMIVFLGGTMLITSMGVYFYQVFFNANVLYKADKRRVMIIPTGSSFQQVRDTLEKGQYIGDMKSFMFVAKALGYQEKVKPGRYILEPNMSNLSAVRLLRSGNQTSLKVTFNNLRLKQDLAGRITRNLELDSAAFLAKLRDPAVAAKYGFDTTTIVAMFLPNTYEMYWNISADQLLDRMHQEYQKFWNEARTARAKQIGLTPVQVSVMASIVEAETKKKDEAPRVAGVYMNRLNSSDPKLYADPTVVYAVGDFALKRVLNVHLKHDSPYNTYMYPGLPPGPINVPSIPYLEAVLNYEKHDYEFFCAKEDFSGYHVFAKTLSEHNENAKKYWAALDKANIR